MPFQAPPDETAARTSTAGGPGPTLESVRRAIEIGRYGEAEAQGRALLDDVRGPDAGPGMLFDALLLLVESLELTGKATDPETIALAHEAEQIAETRFPSGDSRRARILDRMGTLLMRRGDLDGARSRIEQALTAREETFGPDAPEVAESLTSLGILEQRLGRTSQARDLHERALSIRERTFGPDHLDVAESHLNLGLCAMSEGNLEEALAHDERALGIREKLLGPDHPLVATCLEHLGKIDLDRGFHDRAGELWDRCLQIRLATLGPDHPYIAYSLTNLGTALTAGGDYAAARNRFEEALRIKERVYGPGHLELVSTVNNLASLLWRVGDLQASQRLHATVLEILEKNLGPDHRLTAVALTNLAIVEMEIGDTAGAAAHHERALACLEALLGPNHPDVASILNNLAGTREAQERFEEAEELHARALSIRRAALPAGHPDIAQSLDGLAGVALATGRPGRALDLDLQVLSILGAALGDAHPLTAKARIDLSLARFMNGDDDGALESAIEGERAIRSHFHKVAASLSEREALEYEKARWSGIGIALSTLLEGKPGPSARSRVFEEVVRSRAMVSTEVARRHRASHESDDPEVAALGEALAAARNRLARLVVIDAAGDREAIEAALRDREEAERRLAARSRMFRRSMERLEMGSTEVIRALPDGAGLVAFVEFERFSRAHEGPPAPATWFAAFVIAAGDPAPVVIDLGPAEAIRSAIRSWRDVATVEPAGLAPAIAAAERVCRAAGERLRELIWDPVAARLDDPSMVLVTPDGDLNLVSFGTLPASEGEKYLVESLRFHYLAAERDLVPGASTRPTGRGLLAVGGVDFSSAISPDAHGPELFSGSARACHRALTFPPLIGSDDEVATIAALWRTGAPDEAAQVLRGAAASEPAFKRAAPGNRILHLATHSFFVPDRCEPAGAAPGTDAVGAEWQPTGNPLLLSGLALAGVNLHVTSAGGLEDGLLTAEEIAAIDLGGVEWAVLSACDTAMGPIQAGEGVLGIRRAFIEAGVETLVMSLWRVRDDATRAWMSDLYAARSGGLSTVDAVHRADLNRLENLRETRGHSHPFYWGAFVASGNWR